MTKTHCGSRCVNCQPHEWGMETPLSFLEQCASGHAVDADGTLHDVSYPPERVAQAIHLIRNPFDNIIARFHLEHKHKTDDNDSEWLLHHPRNREGFQQWCQDLDAKYYDAEEEFFDSNSQLLKSNLSLDAFLNTPCHADFYRYAQWHRLLHESLDLIPHKLPVLTVYYEDYGERFESTTRSILSFLELEVAHDKRGNVKWQTFHSSDYKDYYTVEHVQQVKDLIKSVSSYQSWGEIKHYFGE
mmetsp:Transcript_7173/g.11344  ORF Transcript_7173/g.11344 Transcript_7173/m.11344 type:complete len:243 (-) Transcript_7173:77-805(-)